MTRRLCFIGILAFLSTFANAAVTITPQSPAIFEDGCYIVSDRETLYGFAAIVNGTEGKAPNISACAWLSRDIVVNENVLTSKAELNVADTANFAIWTPIKNFRGTFNGQGHTISGLYYNDDTQTGIGLFGSVISEAENSAVTIKNVAVSASYLRGAAYVGAIVGRVNAGSTVTISNTRNNSLIEAKSMGAGGLVGAATGNVHLKSGVNWGYVGAASYIGGIVGIMAGNNMTITNAYSDGVVESLSNSAGNTFAGGIVGQVSGSVEIKNVYNLGWIVGYNVMGGIAGALSGKSAVLVNAYNAGQIYPIQENPKNSGAVFGQISVPGENFKYANVYYEMLEGYEDDYAVGLPTTKMQDGTLAYLLRNYQYEGLDATIWGQDVEVSKSYPDFSGEITGAAGLELGTVVLHTGVDDETLTLTYAPGYIFNLPSLSYDGYAFWGWYDNAEFSGEPVKAIPATASGDKILYARWLGKKAPAKDGDGCYVITDASELYGLAAIVNGTDGFAKDNSPCANLGNDIVVNEKVLKQDGSVNEKDSASFIKWTPINDFGGTFDGKGHSISGLYYNVKSDMDLERTGVGLFGTIRGGTSKNPVVVKNVGIEASYFGGVFNVGALIGFVQSETNLNYSHVRILNSYSTSAIRAYQGGGGLVGKFDTYVSGTFVNCYSVGAVEVIYREIGALISGNPSNLAAVNSYYLDFFGDEESYGTPASATQFENGTVAYALHNGEEGSIWGQDVGTDPLPNFNGVVKNYTPTSSSSEASSSSSNETSSSSEVVASSSSNEVGFSSASEPESSESSLKSSETAPSSASSKTASSSSKRGFIPVDFEVTCSGRNCKTALPATMESRKVRVAVVGRNLQLSGVKLGRSYTLFDMQGRIILSGRVDSPDLTISVPRAGNYLLREGYRIVRISVK